MNTRAYPNINTAVFALLCLFMLSKAPSVQAEDTESAGLVLTLSEDQWLDNAHDNSHQGVARHHAPSASPLIDSGQPDRPVGVDCGVDSNPIATESNSWGSRLVGKCNFNYQY